MNKTRKKSNQVGKSNKNLQNAVMILERGEELGNTIMGILSLVAINWEGMGIAAVGMAKALAALKSIAHVEGVEIGGIYSGLLAFYEKDMSDFLEENDVK